MWQLWLDAERKTDDLGEAVLCADQNKAAKAQWAQVLHTPGFEAAMWHTLQV